MFSQHGKTVFLLFFLSTALCARVDAQYYEIFGPEEAGCLAEFYGIESSEQLIHTDWTVIPSSAFIVNEDLYFAEIHFSAPGTYLVIATSYSDSTQFVLSDTLEVYVNVPRALVEGCYEYDVASGCYDVCAFTESLIFLSTGASIQAFEITGAESYTNDGYLHVIWGAGGHGRVIIYDGSCQIELCFNILPIPEANFITQYGSADTIAVCRHEEIFFENLSLNGLNYSWSFGDGNFNTDFHTSHAYAFQGFYTVTLNAESICECADEKTIVIQVLPSAAPTLDCVNSVCAPARQTYTATTDGCTHFEWSVSSNGTIVGGGGTSDDFIEIIWDEGPDGFITLSVSGCQSAYCAQSTVFRIPIVSPDGPITGDASVCSGEISTYTAPYFPGTEYQWQVGPFGSIVGDNNANSIVVQWAQVNVVSNSFVEVEYNNCFLECGGNAVMPVSITPLIAITGDVQVCENGIAEVSAQAGFQSSVPVNVQWHIEDASGNVVYTHTGSASALSHQFTYPSGTYTWIATESSGSYCNPEVRLDIEVTGLPTPPVAIQSPNRICAGMQTAFTVVPSGPFTTIWTITDGSNQFSYEGQVCSHVFGSVGPYVVEAVHANVQFRECISSAISVTLEGISGIQLTGADKACVYTTESYAAEEVSGLDYQWEVIPADHGEVRSTGLSVAEVYWTQSGFATLRLTLCGVVFDKVVEVFPEPAFQLTGDTAACPGLSSAIATNQPAWSHVWKNESGAIVSMSDTLHAFAGSYAVIVTDDHGCRNDSTFTITAWPQPSVHLSTPFNRIYCTVIPPGVTIIANTDGPGYTFEWFFNNVSLGFGGATFPVTSFGDYHVIVTNIYGCTATSYKITFEDCCLPQDCFVPGGGTFPGCAFLPANLLTNIAKPSCERRIYTPAHPDIVPNTTSWVLSSASLNQFAVLFGDFLDYTYHAPGYYEIEVFSELNSFPYGTGQCGHFQRFRDTILAVADFRHEGICAGAEILFEDLTTFLPGEVIASWQWDFGDPSSGTANTSALQLPSHVFATGGTYMVTLSVTLVSGCTSTKTRLVTITPSPFLMPSYDPIYCENEAMPFSLSGELYDIAWDFGDPASGAENHAGSQAALHLFDTPGIYSVYAEAVDVYGCPADTTFDVTINPNTLSGVIDQLPAGALCFGETATLTSSPGGVSWLWSTTETTEQIVVHESNQYDVLVTDADHCTYRPPAVFVEILPEPEVVVSGREILGTEEYGPWQSPLAFCYGTEFELHAFANGTVNYQWSNGENTQIISFTEEGGNLPPAGEYTFWVLGTDPATLCVSDTAVILVEIYPLPGTPVIALTSGSGCGFDANVLTVTNPDLSLAYVWSNGDDGIQITVEKAGPYTVTAYNAHGCSVESNTVIILPSASVDKIPGGCHIACDPLDVCFAPLNFVTAYTVYHNGNVLLSGTAWPPDLEITDDGTYTFEVTSINGCTAVSDPLDILLYPAVGSITVITYEDTNGDGIISPGDALLPGIPVELISADGLHSGKTTTDGDASFVFADYPASVYLALFDQDLLSSEWNILIDSVEAEITTCDDSVVVSLLLTQNCVVTGPQLFGEICPGHSFEIGDSVFTQTGTYLMHMESMSGCDSVFQITLSLHDSLWMMGEVWLDTDHNGLISTSDSLLSGVPLILENVTDNESYHLITGNDGGVHGLFPTAEWHIAIDTAALSGNLVPLTYAITISDTVCGISYFAFLVESLCPVVFIGQTAELCTGDSVLIEGTWLDSAGIYQFVLGDPETGCDTIMDVQVQFFPALSLSSSVEWNCTELGSVFLSIEGQEPYAYAWSGGISGSDSLFGVFPGEYSVTVTDANGCSDADTVLMEADPLFEFFVDPVHTAMLGDSVLIEITGDIEEPGLVISWMPSSITGCPTCVASNVIALSDTIVLIQIIDDNGCEYLLETLILVSEDTAFVDDIYIPNVFSPNEDGINDKWTPLSRHENTHINKLSLFDRWGELIFQRQDFLLQAFDGWDGSFREKTMNPGVFVYVIEAMLADGRRVMLSGDVTLIR